MPRRLAGAYARGRLHVAPLIILCTALLASPDDDALKRAQTHYRAGKTLYDLGNYPDAIREFAAGYALAPRPEFLINLGQAYRRSNDLPKAREMFAKYLERAPVTAPERPQVRETLKQIDDELARLPPPVTDRPVVEPTPTLTPPPVAPTPELKEEPSPARHLAWAIPVAVVVIAGAVVGIWAATRPAADPCANAGGLGCFDLRPR